MWQQQAARVRAGNAVHPDTVTVADPFTLTITIEAPSGARISWPSLARDGVVAPYAPVAVNSTKSGALLQETAVYKLAAWDTGSVAVGMPDAIVMLADSSVISVPVDASVYVRTVLPGDTTMRVPREQRPLFPRVAGWWEQWWMAALAVALVALVIAAAWRKRRRAVNRAVEAIVEPYDRALREFAALERLELVSAGETGHHVSASLDILRAYLTARVPELTYAQTGRELLLALRGNELVPEERLAALFEAGEAVRFGNAHLTPERARSLAREARAIASEVEEREVARRKREAADADNARQSARKERSEAEDKARRKSVRKPVKRGST